MNSDRSPRVECPVCLSQVVLDEDDLWEWDAGAYLPLDIDPDLTPTQRGRILRGALVRCPNRGRDDLPDHYLPHRYIGSTPLVIALVGAPSSGKTHFLASLIRSITNQPLHDFGLDVAPLDVGRYERFLNTKVRPLFDHRLLLQRTREEVWDFEVSLLVSRVDDDSAPAWAVTFFDVAGEDLTAPNRAAQRVFLEGADAYVFVIDGQQLSRGASDSAFSTVLGFLDKERKRATVSTLVLGKADLFRFDHPVDRWLRAGPPTASPELVERESRDLFAHIRQYREADLWLSPWVEFGRSSIHAVSATGGSELRADHDDPEQSGADKGAVHYARPIRPQRVLQPFVSLLAMTGVIGTGEAGKVGR